MDTPSRKLVDMYKPPDILLEYLQYLTIDDLKVLTQYDLIEAVDPNNRHALLQMKIYARATLEGCYGHEDPWHDESLSNQRGKVQSQVWAGLNHGTQTMSGLVDNIRKSTITLTSLDLSHNGLFACDLQYVSKIKENSPLLSFIDLSHNRILSTPETDHYLIGLLDSKVMVDISVNEICTVGYKSFFNGLSTEQLAHLIWISEMYLGTETWKAIISDSSKYETILETHRKYYHTSCQSATGEGEW